MVNYILSISPKTFVSCLMPLETASVYLEIGILMLTNVKI